MELHSHGWLVVGRLYEDRVLHEHLLLQSLWKQYLEEKVNDAMNCYGRHHIRQACGRMTTKMTAFSVFEQWLKLLHCQQRPTV
jgi:hypothetical protein